jgi:hypothetical protein
MAGRLGSPPAAYAIRIVDNLQLDEPPLRAAARGIRAGIDAPPRRGERQADQGEQHDRCIH